MKTSNRKQTRAASQMAALMTTTPLVISQRMMKFASTGPFTTAADRRENRLMVSEKLQASTEAMLAMTATAARIQLSCAALMATAWLPASIGRGNPFTSLSSLFQNALAEVASSGMAPLVKRTTANAKRLSR